MTQAVRHIGPGQTVTPFKVGGLSEEEARATFRAFRFAANDGNPYCVWCGCDAIYEYTSRKIYKCKSCGKQFSDTSDTPFAFKKLPFKELLFILASVNKAGQGISALSLADDLEVQHKTVRLWMHKIREEMATVANGYTFCEELEVDGAEHGPKNRPTNTQKKKGDVRRSCFRYKHSKMDVVVARQRNNGPIATFITKEEGWAAPVISSRTTLDAKVYTDAGAWTPFKKHRHFVVEHKTTFCTPEACTNLAENFHYMMRSFAKTHRHIVDRYLDLYAAHVGWWVQHCKTANADRFSSLMQMMSRKGKSPLTGYFQGKKRMCRVVEKDGSFGEWCPPPPAERKRLRALERAERNERNGKEYNQETDPFHPNYSASHKYLRRAAWRDEFTFISGEEFVISPEIVPARPGIYAIFVDGADEILTRSGYVENCRRPIWRIGDAVHLYTGESGSTRTRLLEHLMEHTEASNFGETLLALQWCLGALPDGPNPTSNRDSTDIALAAWLRGRVKIGYKVISYPKTAESIILQKTASPLNISEREGEVYARKLRDMRRQFREELASAWPPLPKRKAWGRLGRRPTEIN